MDKINNYKQNRIAFYFFIFSLGLIISFIIIDMIYLSKKSHTLLINNLVKEVYQKELTLQNDFKNSKSILENISNSKYFKTFVLDKNFEELKTIFQLLAQNNKNIIQLKYIDASGIEQISIPTKDNISKKEYKNLPYFKLSKQLEKEKVWFSDIEKVDSHLTINSILVIKNHSQFEGIFVLKYKIEELEEINPQYSLYNFILLDSEGSILSKNGLNEDSKLIKDFFAKQNLPNENLIKEEHFVSLNLNIPIEKKIFLIVKLKDNFIEKKYKERTDRYIVVSALVLILSLFVSIIFSRYLKKVNFVLENTQKEKINLDEEIKLKTKELEDSKKRITDILDNITDFVWQVDKNGTYTYASSQVKTILGFETQEIVGKKIFDFMDEKETTRIKEIFEQLAKNRLPIKELVNKNIHKNGKKIWLETNANPIINDQGDLLGYRGTDRDITKRREQDTQIKKINNELKLLNKTLENRVKEEIEKNKVQEVQLFNQAKMAAMGDMLGNIAHQWRQPLSYISTTASGIKLNYEFNLLRNEDIPTAMEQIVSKTQYLSQTIETFRNFLMEKKEYQEAILQDRIEIALNIVNASLKDNHIFLEKVMDYTQPIRSKIVLGELSEVIINIINNAKDILISRKIPNPWIIVELTQIDNTAVLTIEDNAGGIDEEVMSRIFEPYFTTKDLSVGTGLGLYMSYKIVKDSLHGKLSVQNTEFGAKFIVELPINKED